MKNQISFYINEGGEIANKKAVKTAFVLKPGKYTLEIKSNNHRSLPQNKFYWGVCVPLVLEGLQEVGYREITTSEQTHEMLKTRFLKHNIPNEKTGEVLEIIGSTSKLSTIEFNNYIDKIAQFAAEYLSVTIPEPGQQSELSFTKQF